MKKTRERKCNEGCDYFQDNSPKCELPSDICGPSDWCTFFSVAVCFDALCYDSDYVKKEIKEELMPMNEQ